LKNLQTTYFSVSLSSGSYFVKDQANDSEFA